MKEITYGFSDGPFDQMVIGMSDLGICWLGFMTTIEQGAYKGDAYTRMRAHFPKANFIQNDEAVKQITPIIIKAWEQDRLSDLELDLVGTDFQKSVWSALLCISKGELKSYGDVARDIGKPKASRAVGTAVGDNPVSLIIPCHRVVQKTGAMGNYGWGVPLKEKILKAENALPTNQVNRA